VIAGGGNFALEVAEACEAVGLEVAAMIEAFEPSRVDARRTPPVIWVDDHESFDPGLPAVIGITQLKRRPLIERLERDGRQMLTVIHPTAFISPSAVIEDGCLVLAGVVLGAHVRIGRCTVLNRACTIGHHTVIGPHSFVGPGAAVAGEITIGEQVHIAVGATVRDDLTIGDRAVVGAGAAAVSNVPADTTVVGVPAKPLTRNA
jgi:sugar O-acyltransferase (sialic acid O-acetyltransferase NeuD family)